MSIFDLLLYLGNGWLRPVIKCLHLIVLGFVSRTLPSFRVGASSMLVLGRSRANQVPLELNELGDGDLVHLLPFRVIYIWHEWMVEGLRPVRSLFVFIVLLLDHTLQKVYLHIRCLST